MLSFDLWFRIAFIASLLSIPGYQCKKEVTLNKHINTKPTKQKCKVCDEEFETSIEMFKHVAENHNCGKDESIKEKEEKEWKK